MENVTLKINGQDITVPANYTVLQAARKAGISIPTLCYLKDVSQTGSCRMCVVEVKGARNLQAACVYPVAEGLEVFTNTPKVRRSRKVTLELLLSNHDRKCLTCARNQNCELQTLSEELGIDDLMDDFHWVHIHRFFQSGKAAVGNIIRHRIRANLAAAGC